MITQKRLKELLHYCPDSGQFTRLVGRRGGVRAGDVAGGLDGNGYIVIMIDEKSYKAHRLAFLYMTGKFPPSHTDHINGHRDDNRWVNLRAVTQAENNRNAKRISTNTSGVTGVLWYEPRRKWVARIQVKGKRKHLGYFDDFQEAVSTRKSAELKYNYHSNHGRVL